MATTVAQTGPTDDTSLAWLEICLRLTNSMKAVASMMLVMLLGMIYKLLTSDSLEKTSAKGGKGQRRDSLLEVRGFCGPLINIFLRLSRKTEK